MRFLLISLLAVLLVNIVQAQEEFKGEKVTLGKKKCTCSFMLEVDGDKCSGKGGCDKKCSGSGSVEIGRYSFTLKVKKGKAAISKCKAEVESTPLPTTAGSGSGEEPITMPPAPGSGSGSGPSPPVGEGMQCRCKCDCPDGSGECDCDCNCPMQSTAMTCASGFTRVCPMVEDACPEDMDMMCPMNAASRMGGAEAEGTEKVETGMDDDRHGVRMPLTAGRVQLAVELIYPVCQCVPDFLMSLVSPGMPPAAVRLGATAREAVEASIKVGKTQCKCTFDMAVDGLSCKKSKGRCDKKCNGAAKGVELMDGMYMLDMKVKKGKVTIAKCAVTPIALTGTGTGSGTGSGEGAGGMGGMGSRCACVGKGMGGSGPPPPTGSGSGPPSGGPVLPTGGPVLQGGPVLPTGGTVLPTEGPVPPTGTGSGSASDDEVITRVKSYIDSSTCNAVTYSDYSDSVCGDNAVSYYKEFTYNNKRVLVSNNIPDHPAENDMLTSNPNVRCPGWQFIQLPIDPAKGSSATNTALGTIGLAITGGAFFNDLSNPDGSLALPNEGASLDSCLGHSAPAAGGGGGGPPGGGPPGGGPPPGRRYKRQGTPTAGRYHYHANLNCSDAGAATGANDPDTCLLIGYYNDGVPVYGFCKDTNGMLMTSCYKTSATLTTTITVSGTYETATSNSDYTYTPDSLCNLDEASGAVHPTTGQYSYFMTTGYPWTPIKYFGDQEQGEYCGAD